MKEMKVEKRNTKCGCERTVWDVLDELGVEYERVG